MLAKDRDAVICDLAETYHILDYQALPLTLLATLCVGLPDSSRIKRRLAGAELPIDQMLLMTIADRLAFLCWAQTEDGHKGLNRPQSILDMFIKKDTGVVEFATIEAFEAARAKIVGE